MPNHPTLDMNAEARNVTLWILALALLFACSLCWDGPTRPLSLPEAAAPTESASLASQSVQL